MILIFILNYLSQIYKYNENLFSFVRSITAHQYNYLHNRVLACDEGNDSFVYTPPGWCDVHAVFSLAVGQDREGVVTTDKGQVRFNLHQERQY